MLVYAKIKDFSVELVDEQHDEPGFSFKKFDVPDKRKAFYVKLEYEYSNMNVDLSTRPQNLNYYLVSDDEFSYSTDSFSVVIKDGEIVKCNYIEIMRVNEGSKMNNPIESFYPKIPSVKEYIEYVRESTGTRFNAEIPREIDAVKVNYLYVVEYYKKTKRYDEQSAHSLAYFNFSNTSYPIIKDILEYLKNTDAAKDTIKKILLSNEDITKSLENLELPEINILADMYDIDKNKDVKFKASRLAGIVSNLKLTIPQINEDTPLFSPSPRSSTAKSIRSRTNTISIQRSRANTVQRMRSNSSQRSRSNTKSSMGSATDLVGRESTIQTDIEITMDDFFKYVLVDLVNCTQREVFIEELKNNGLVHIYTDKMVEDSNCNVIKTNVCSTGEKYNCQKYKTIVAVSIINLYIKEGLLSKRGNYYYLLDTNKRLNWYNIKILNKRDIENFPGKQKLTQIFTGKNEPVSDDNILIFIKSMLWFFRKAIVDSVVSDVINRKNSNVKAMSVGSTKLTSDYDVTLGGNYEDNGFIIHKYENIINVLFKTGSDALFDTNVYGASFIKNEQTDVFSEMHTDCGGKFFYIKQDKYLETSQHIWAFVKFLMKVDDLAHKDDKLFSYINDMIHMDLVDNPVFVSAQTLLNRYESDIENYRESVRWSENFMNINRVLGTSEAYLEANFISFVNYNGSETYLCLGSFLDVVVNAQICKKDSTKIIKLTKHHYIDSFIENSADLLSHIHKTKYLERCMNSIEYLQKLEGKNSSFSKISDNLKKISDIQSKCGDVLACPGNILIALCTENVLLITKWFMATGDNSDMQEQCYKFDSLVFNDFGPEFVDKSVVDMLIE